VEAPWSLSTANTRNTCRRTIWSTPSKPNSCVSVRKLQKQRPNSQLKLGNKLVKMTTLRRLMNIQSPHITNPASDLIMLSKAWSHALNFTMAWLRSRNTVDTKPELPAKRSNKKNKVTYSYSNQKSKKLMRIITINTTTLTTISLMMTTSV